jgi:hypothetical protein
MMRIRSRMFNKKLKETKHGERSVERCDEICQVRKRGAWGAGWERMTWIKWEAPAH